jgi:hypothetical protein
MRTDRTFVCTDCRVRTWPVRRCPACGETVALVDLEREPGRIDALPRPVDGSGRETAAVTTGLLGGLGLAGSILSGLGGMIGLAELGLLISLPLVFGSAVLWPRNRQRIVPGDLRFRVLDAPVVRARAARVTERGEVRAGALLTAPLSGRACVAWRLQGEGPRGALDDAEGSVFFVRRGDGEPDLEVDATIATLELPLPAGELAPLPPPGEARRAWLRARAVDRLDAPLLVREAVLLEGDEVEIVGTTRRETRADGYRGSSTREVMADLPGSPLLVRPPPPVTPTGDSATTPGGDVAS